MKRIYSESMKMWAIKVGIPFGSIGTSIGLIFLYLSLSGAITITGFSGDQVCAGTIENPCYAYINFTANEDIFIYPLGYDPWGRNTIFEFSPAVKDWKLQRSWGKGWRDIPLNETCTGTWCGAPNNKGVSYSWVLREDRDYKVRIVALKNSPYDTIKWAVNYEDREYLDPAWLGPQSNRTIKENLMDEEYKKYLRESDSIRIKKDGYYKSYYGDEKRLLIEDSKYETELELKLISNYKVDNLIASNDTMISELQLIDWKDGNEFFSLVDYYNIKNNYSKINREFRYKYAIDTEVCDKADGCYTNTKWVEFTSLDELPHKNIRITLWTNTFINEHIEWVPTISGFEVLEWQEWEISAASYDSVSFSITEDSSPRGLFFKPDGTKMYIVGTGNNDVYQYSCSDAWNISSCSYDSVSFSISEDSSARGINFKTDGTFMYIVGVTSNDIFQYSLSTAWNLSTASYTSTSYPVSQAGIRGVNFKPDGTKMYVDSTADGEVYQYSLSTPWNVSTASYDSKSLDTGSINTDIGSKFSQDGTKIFVLKTAGNDYLDQYKLSTPWDISTGVFDSLTFGVSSQVSTLSYDLFFINGTDFFVLSNTNDAIYKYSMPFYDENPGKFFLGNQEVSPRGLSFKPDGTKMYIVGTANKEVYQYSLSTPWNVSTATYDSVSFSVSEDSSTRGLRFSIDGTFMYIVGATSNDIFQYSLSTAWNLSTASYTSTSYPVSQDTGIRGVNFKPDGTKMYVDGVENGKVYQYSLSTPWNVSTATYDSKSLDNGGVNDAIGSWINDDGSEIYILNTASGTDPHGINKYSLSTAWDLSTDSFISNWFNITEIETGALSYDLFLRSNDFYIVSSDYQTIYQFSTEDSISPTYSNININSTVSGQLIKFSILWNDETELNPIGQYIFSTNNTGTWTNDSEVNFTTTPNWANVTKILNSTEGLSIGYRWYATDNAQNTNDTGIQTLTTTGADTCTYSSGNWNIDCSDNCFINSPVNVGGNSISIIGTGTFTTSSKISNFLNLLIKGTDVSNRCIVTCNGACFEST